jgi:electron transfer flavoprotein alpha subunit
MAVLVIAAHDNASLKESTAKVVTAAAAIGGDIDVLVAGENAGAAAAAAAKIAGVRKVLHADGASLSKQGAEALEATIVPLAGGYDAILFVADTTGKNAAPRVAAKLDVMQISGVIEVVSASTFVRPIYAGNALMTVESTDARKVVTVQPTAFKPAAEGGSASVETVAAAAGPFKSAFVGEDLAKSDRPELTAAKRIVSGGRALGSNDQFRKMIEPLADKIGAAVGASRAAVDAGYAPNDYQVGQTGKVVAPELYIAIGISGAIQHLAGMKDSKVIVAINKEEDAPIFQVADYGLVGDLFAVLPELEAELSKIGY